MENIERAFDARRHLHELAHLSIDTSKKTPEQALRTLVARLPENACGAKSGASRRKARR